MENSNILIYQTENGDTKIETRLEDETVWLTQAQMADLFQKSRVNVTEHIGHIFKEGELDESAVCRNFRHTAADGKNYNTTFYNLDVIISVGYRVKSHQGTKFRQWATARLREYIVKGVTYGRKKEIVGYFLPESQLVKPKRKLGILEGKAKVTFKDDFKMSEEDLIG